MAFLQRQLSDVGSGRPSPPAAAGNIRLRRFATHDSNDQSSRALRDAEMGVSPFKGAVVDAAEVVRTEAANMFQGDAEAAMPTEEMLGVR